MPTPRFVPVEHFDFVFYNTESWVRTRKSEEVTVHTWGSIVIVHRVFTRDFITWAFWYDKTNNLYFCNRETENYSLAAMQVGGWFDDE